ncbi:hypothetical protein R3P38DRAFT_3288305 [Favolaschia claudopus]|uniref:Uncharacterized protein n=1 Tax=Favolaschia claudopus TaxID=2862362 RepID=A0AAV9ZXF1_9AGAR
MVRAHSPYSRSHLRPTDSFTTSISSSITALPPISASDPLCKPGNAPRCSQSPPRPYISAFSISLPPRQLHLTLATPDALATTTPTPWTPSTSSLANAGPNLFPRCHVTTPPSPLSVPDPIAPQLPPFSILSPFPVVVATPTRTTPDPRPRRRGPTSHSLPPVPPPSRPSALDPAVSRGVVSLTQTSPPSTSSPHAALDDLISAPPPILETPPINLHRKIDVHHTSPHHSLCLLPFLAPTSLAHGPDRFPHRPSTSTRRRRCQRGTRSPHNPPPRRLQHTVSLDAAAFVNPADLDLLKIALPNQIQTQAR